MTPARYVAAALCLVVATLAPVAVVGDGEPLDAEARVLFGRRDRSGVTLGVVSAGVSHRVSPALRSSARLLLMTGGATGVQAAPTPLGIGGDLAARVTPSPTARVRPTASVATGLLLLPSGPFFEGGARYVFVLSAAVGIEADIGVDDAVRLEFVSSHLSNGQGVGEHNPAVDAWGVGIGWTPGLRQDSVPDGPGLDDDGLATRPTPSVHADAVAGLADSEPFLDGRVTHGVRFARRFLAQAQASLGTLAGETATGGEAALAARAGWLRPAASLGAARWAGLRKWTAALQLELDAGPELSLVTEVVYQRIVDLDERWSGAVGVRAYPLRWVALEAATDLFRSDDGIEAHAWMGAWIRATGRRAPVAVDAGVQARTGSLHTLTLRLGWGDGTSIRTHDRHASVRRLR